MPVTEGEVSPATNRLDVSADESPRKVNRADASALESAATWTSLPCRSAVQGPGPGEHTERTSRKKRALRVAAFLFALAALAITVPLAVDAGRRSVVVAVLGVILAVTPYVVVRAIEELTVASVDSAQN